MPDKLNILKIFLLISGILNILTLFGMGIITIVTGLTTCGIGCCIGILPVINIISAILDFIAYNKLSQLNISNTYSTLQTAFIMEIVSFITGNIISAIFGIIGIIYINEEEIKNYLKSKNIY